MFIAVLGITRKYICLEFWIGKSMKRTLFIDASVSCLKQIKWNISFICHIDFNKSIAGHTHIK